MFAMQKYMETVLEKTVNILRSKVKFANCLGTELSVMNDVEETEWFKQIEFYCMIKFEKEEPINGFNYLFI